MRRIASYVSPDTTLDVVKEDPDDNRILECAVEAESDFIVTGDKHLLRMGVFRQLRIVTPAEFLQIAQQS
jgi:predicted nucleic acid-binding protein